MMARKGRIGPRRSRRIKKKRRSSLRVWAGRLGKTALMTAMCGSLTFLGLQVYRYVQHFGTLNVGEIKIMGCLHTSESELLHLCGIDFQTSLLSLDLNQISGKISRNPWVEKAQVKRDWSRKALIIEVHERVPQALILLDDLYFLDGSGKAFKKAEGKDRLDLPILTGLKAGAVMQGDKTAAALIRQALDFLEVLKRSTSFTHREISEINLSPQKGITVIALNGMAIRLGSGDFAAKIARLEKILPDLQPKLREVEYLDLNYPKKVVVKMRTPEKDKSRRA